MGPEAGREGGDEVAVVSYRKATRIVKVTAIHARGRIEADGALWFPDGTAFLSVLLGAAPGDRDRRASGGCGRRDGAWSGSTRDRSVSGFATTFHGPHRAATWEVAVHLEATLALLDGAK